jgi:uncharacterized protein YecE (DUF72 family)
MSSVKYYIGTSGWHYNHWKGSFYPPHLPAKDWLKYYAQDFNTVEINASFYRLPLESTFTNWRQEAPPGFCYAVKASRFITHIKRLKDSREPLNTFLTRAKCLESSLGPILYQLPPGLHRDDQRLADFLAMLDRKLQHVFEFRHSSWMNEEVFSLLRKYRAGFCIFDMPGFTSPIVFTADFAYFRFHGKGELYSGNYPDSDLAEWAEKIQKADEGVKTVYIYFNNDAGGFAIQNASTLRGYLEENHK